MSERARETWCHGPFGRRLKLKITVSGRGRLLLERAGWIPGRQIDVSQVVANLQEVGFEVSDAAHAFLEMFWKLRIEHPPSVVLDDAEIFCWTEFDPMLVCTERSARIARRCAGVAGESLCPLGIDGFHLTIYLSPAGRYLAGMDSVVYRYAEGVDEFFAKLADGRRPQPIGEWLL
ncbi:SUKH-3 domain-containing protein [Amycolatopsis cynarae]|uniref:SUKH-3 domain-containing protein n=1 Tax=Amycolatopsis cynarae TaxID=2995223 RepID=UPI003898EE04